MKKDAILCQHCRTRPAEMGGVANAFGKAMGQIKVCSACATTLARLNAITAMVVLTDDEKTKGAAR